MTPHRWKQIDEVFQSAADLTTRSRGRYLDTRCAGDADLRREVESLLLADEDSEQFVGEKLSALDVFADIADGTLPAGGMVGEYRLIRLIGTGGMGSVYLGERADGEFQQQVAIKFIRKGHDVRWATSRFRSERRILARLQHPNIARLLGGGSTQNGSPYLVMEFVEGIPLHEWLAARDRSPREILTMFLALCEAVSYAHRNLIVHRDIKPGNILIQPDGQPKLLDFGISKPVESHDQSTVTLHGAMTPAYASPEQVRGEFVSTSSDIYSLGAVLYEALAGRAPFQLDRATPAEVERLICETEASALTAVPDDLAKIVHKAIHKAPDRRYSSVEHFAEDIQRYLSGRPVHAQADSLWYRARKFIARNRTVVGLAAVAMVLAGVLGFHLAKNAIRMNTAISQLRKMANAYISELPEGIENSDAVTIRLKMAALYDLYATPLVTELRDTPEVGREVARGYEKLGHVLGIGFPRSAGRNAEARRYFEKAIELLEPTYGPNRGEFSGKAILGRSHCGVGRLQQLAGESPHDSYAKCLSILESITGRSPGRNATHVREYLAAHALSGDSEPDAAKAKAHYETIVRIATALRDHKKDAKQTLLWKAHGHWRLWHLLHDPAHLKEARLAMNQEREQRAALDVDDRLLEWWIDRDLATGRAATLLEALHHEFPGHPLITCESGSAQAAPSAPCAGVATHDRTQQPHRSNP